MASITIEKTAPANTIPDIPELRQPGRFETPIPTKTLTPAQPSAPVDTPVDTTVPQKINPDIQGSVATDTVYGGANNDTLDNQVLSQHTDNQTQDNLNFSLPDRKTSVNATEKTKVADPADTFGIRFYNGTAAIASDIYTGVKEAPGQAMHGALDAVEETFKKMDDLALWLNDHGLPTQRAKEIQSGSEPAIGSPESKFNFGKTPEAQSVTGGLVHDASQFLVGFLPTMKALKEVTYAADTWKGINFLRTVLAGGSSGITFAPHEEQLFNLMEQYGPEITAPIAHYLAASPNDSEIAGITKQALSGMLGNTIGEGLFSALGLLKFARQAKGTTAGVPPPKVTAADFVPAVKTTEIKVPEGVQPNSKEYWQAEADKNDAVITDLKAKGENLTKADQYQFDPLGDGTEPFSGKKPANRNTPQPDQWMKDLSEADQKTLKEAQDFQEVYAKKIEKAKTSEELAKAKATTQENIYAGTQGQTHENIKSALPKEQQTAAEHGYVDKNGKFHTPEEVAKAVDAAKVEQEKAVAKASALKFVGKPGEGFVSQAAHDAYIEGKGSLQGVLDSMNLGSITSAANLNEAIVRISKLVKVGRKYDNKPIGIEEKVTLANRLGTNVLELTNTHPQLFSDRGMFTAVQKLIEASRSSIIKQAEAIGTNVTNAQSEGVLYNFIKSISNHRASLHWLKTGDENAVNKMLKEYPTPTGDVSSQVNQMASALSTKGGAKVVRDLARSITDKIQSDGKAAAADLFERSTKTGVFKTISGILQQWWYFNLLSGPVTQVRNIFGNTANFAYQVPVRFLAEQVQRVSRDPNGVQPGEAAQMVYGYLGSLRDGWEVARQAFKTGKLSDASSKLDHDVPNYLTADKFGWSGVAGQTVDAMGKIAMAPGRALFATDEFFKILARNAQVRALALRDGISKGLEGDSLRAYIDTVRQNPTDEMLNEAQHFARQLTFTEQLGPTGQAVQNFLNKGDITAKLVIPFIRTSANMFKEGLSNSPLNAPGAYTTLKLAAKAFNSDIAVGGARAQLAMSKFLIGTGITALITEEVLNDRVTGYGPVNPAARETWLKTHQPYSVWMGDRWVSYQWMQPLALNIGVTASMAESFGPLRPDNWNEASKQVSLAFSKSALSQTFIRDLSQFLNIANDPTGNGALNWLNQEASTLAVPSVMTQLSNMLDPTQRIVNNPVEAIREKVDPMWMEVANFVATIRGQQPSLSSSLPPRRNRWAQPYWNNALGPDIISPIYQNIPDGRKINQWLQDNHVPLQMPNQVQFGKADHGGIKLTPHEYDNMLVVSAQVIKDPQSHKNMYDTLDDIVNGKGPYANTFHHLTPGPYGGQASMILGLIQNFDAAARYEMQNQHSKYYEKDMVDRLNLSRKQKGYNMLNGPGEVQ